MRRLPLVNLVLFLLTAASTYAAGGPAYAAGLLAILLTHELGHYFVARLHRVDSSLPYFIPLPIGFGTLGAVIRIRSELPSRRAVLDIGVAGPIAGFLVALPMLFWGFAHSEVAEGVPAAGAGHPSPFTFLLAWARGERPYAPLVTAFSSLFGDAPPPEPEPIRGMLLMGDSAITWLAARLTHGALAPGSDLVVHPIAFAAWIGMFVTALNLLPVGQLDGGHAVYALFGRHGRLVSKLGSWALFGLGIFASWSWFVWWALTRYLVGLGHPPPADDAPLGPGRRAVAIGALVLLALTFVPFPLRIV